MSNAVLVPNNMGQVSTRFGNIKPEDDLSAGVEGGFGIIGYKGKVWSLRYRGEKTELMRPDGDGPRNSIEVVILRAPKVKSKIYYPHFNEGSREPPTCYSTNGVTPAADAVVKQSPTCAGCPQNVWGSKITESGKKGKACADSKRLVVVPLADINNAVYGGPMLLRVPAASLQALADYGAKMQQLGFPYFAVGTRVSFEPTEAYPKFSFGAIRVLTDEEADLVMQVKDTPLADRILAEGSDTVPVQAQASGVQAAITSAFEQPPEKVTSQVTAPVAPRPTSAVAPARPAVATAPAAATAATAAPASPPASTAAPGTTTAPSAQPAGVAAPESFEDALDEQLNALMP